MTLSDYLKQNGITRFAFAARVGVHASTIGRLCRGETAPEASLLAAIVRETQGAVLPNDLFPAVMAQVPPQGAAPSEAEPQAAA
ncbi:helix-turn-helix transcriptional regulator [Roseococcus sp. SDR]|uniref:helix-turn-helix domain-containing protein n=1 Tax=Roseococcus sp. SDR TaxID=2835532 RepID=UPI001BCEA51D|nr:helix-turn-helix transcriptional regulator [Roseococcus sp. SDR]MBS7792188.1 helix-turn-helix transcriptional regulator [Roseococcus sp. SDR]MBV1847502.1 helix-turn-helix transcriptional regulator [Roseococcus sp. SDR]